jgi:crotonobetainyl-CoA:carnitine CoA-transferase CaiB-like acyl-CoA transferase
MTVPSALQGLRVYDASMGIAGPSCTEMMALSGAEVIKIEPPGGDWCRGIGQRFNGLAAHFLTYNRGKKSIVLDLKSAEGRAIARRLIASCDIVVESFRPGVMKRLGLDYETLAAAQPQLIYLSISGFGQTGPYASLPAFDTVIQAFSGWMHINRGSDGAPVLMDHLVVDIATGLYAFQACCTALIAQLRFGRGTYIDASLMATAAALLAPRLTEHILADGQPKRSYDAPMGVWPTADGLLALVIKDQPEFRALCDLMNCTDLAQDSRFASREARMANARPLSELVGAALKRRGAAEWETLLRAKGVTGAKVRTFGEFLDDPHVRAGNVVREVGQPGLGKTPLVSIPGLPNGASLAGAPRIGEHGQEILTGIGLSPSEIDTLLEAGTVGRGADAFS